MIYLTAALRTEIPPLAGFALASLLAWALNIVVRFLHVKQIRKLIEYHENKTIGQVDAEFKQLMNDFDMKFAALIGKSERLLYVYSVMVAHYEIIGGWLVLKAFFGWLEGVQYPKQSRQGLSVYHVYLYGNALSLLLGLACGAVGVFLSTVLDKWLAK